MWARGSLGCWTGRCPGKRPSRWRRAQRELPDAAPLLLGADPRPEPSGSSAGWGSAPAAARPSPRPACAHSAVFAPGARRRSAVSGRSLGFRVRGRCGAGHFSAARLAAAPAAARPRAHAGHQVRGGRRRVSALSRAAGAEGPGGGYGVRRGGATDARGPGSAAPPRPRSPAACAGA